MLFLLIPAFHGQLLFSFHPPEVPFCPAGFLAVNGLFWEWEFLLTFSSLPRVLVLSCFLLFFFFFCTTWLCRVFSCLRFPRSSTSIQQVISENFLFVGASFIYLWVAVNSCPFILLPWFLPHYFIFYVELHKFFTYFGCYPLKGYIFANIFSHLVGCVSFY